MHWPKSTHDLLHFEPSIETVVFHGLLDTHWNVFWSSVTLEGTEVSENMEGCITDAEWEATMIIVEAHVTNAALLAVGQCGCWDKARVCCRASGATGCAGGIASLPGGGRACDLLR